MIHSTIKPTNASKSKSLKSRVASQKSEIKRLDIAIRHLLVLLTTTYSALLTGSEASLRALQIQTLRVCLDELLSPRHLEATETSSSIERLRELMMQFSFEARRAYPVILPRLEPGLPEPVTQTVATLEGLIS